MQSEKAKRLSERTVDYGLAAMDFCEALPHTAAGRMAACGRSASVTSSQRPTASVEENLGRIWGETPRRVIISFVNPGIL